MPVVDCSNSIVQRRKQLHWTIKKIQGIEYEQELNVGHLCKDCIKRLYAVLQVLHCIGEYKLSDDDMSRGNGPGQALKVTALEAWRAPYLDLKKQSTYKTPWESSP